MGNKIPPRKQQAFNAKLTVRGPTHTGPVGRAKVLEPRQIDMAIELAPQYAMYGERDRLFVLLSHFAGLRAHEIAHLWLEDITDVQGTIINVINVSKRAAKYGKERTLALREDVRLALASYVERAGIESGPIFWTQRGDPMTSNAVQKQLKSLYLSCGFKGARSHSGRRYAITTMARKANTVGRSLKDVQIFAGHSDISTTEIYIDAVPNTEALVALL